MFTPSDMAQAKSDTGGRLDYFALHRQPFLFNHFSHVQTALQVMYFFANSFTNVRCKASLDCVWIYSNTELPSRLRGAVEYTVCLSAEG